MMRGVMDFDFLKAIELLWAKKTLISVQGNYTNVLVRIPIAFDFTIFTTIPKNLLLTSEKIHIMFIFLSHDQFFDFRFLAKTDMSFAFNIRQTIVVQIIE